MAGSSKILLKTAGLYTDPNLLSSAPEGALVEADNIIIDRDGVIQSRRGNAVYGNTMGISSDRANQLLTYKQRILPHVGNKLYYNSVAHTENTTGTFLAFSGTYDEVTPGYRIKYAESNKNLYFCTLDGVKKIAAKTASDFTTAANFIRDAGVLQALDVNGSLDFTSDGFLPSLSKVGYVVVWAYRDVNNNLLLGAPSSRYVITNYSTVSANVNLDFTVPSGITSEYFYQVYRTAVFIAQGGLGIDDIDPGNEMNLVIEDFPTPSQISAGSVQVTDIAPEDFRQNGLPLYTNPNIGGANQANFPPPKAHDVAMYQNTLFYANTETRASKQINLLGVDGLISNTSYVKISQGLTSNIYTFVGKKEISEINFTSYIGVIPTDTNGKYWLINAGSNIRKYYVWYDTSKTTQTLAFANYIGTIPVDLDTRYVIIPTASDRTYYIWFDATGTSVDPGLDPLNTQLTGLLSIKVDISSGVTTKAQLAAAIAAAMTTNNIYNDYDVVYSGGNTFLKIETDAFDEDTADSGENVQKGFTYSIVTDADSDPANTPLVNTDVVGRIGFRIKVARNVTTTAELADATAAGIEEQDTAQDFDVAYTPAATLLTITNSNNGKADDSIDSLINGLDDGFAITVTQQGDGEDSALLHVLLSDAATPSQQIDETAKSLVRVINKNASEIVNATYLSGPNDLPGQILLTVRDIGTNSFQITANNATTGALFNPPLTPAAGAALVEGLPEIKPNRLYYAKTQQPEAVPLLNYIDIGPEDQEISRIIALREALFILKTDGVYRLTGANGSFAEVLLDGNARITAPDSAVTLNNEIYCLTTQGIVKISDTGVTILSDRLDNIIKTITSDQYDFRYTSFGVSYETDRAYILWLPSEKTDTVATQALRYNIFTDSYTIWPITKTCGLVNPGDNRLYLGAADGNFIERERKNFDRTDYADRQENYTLGDDEVSGDQITLPTANITVEGDAIVQTQYLTIAQYNQLLQKLDLDPFVGAKQQFTASFTSYSGTIPTDLHKKFFIMYSARNAIKYVVFYDSIGDVTALSPIEYPEVSGATQIRVDISSGITTNVQLASATQIAIVTSTDQFLCNYISGNNFFTVQTIISGITTAPADSTDNPIADGFLLTVTTTGFGSYYDTLQAVPGDNLKTKLEELANKLDIDPGVNQTNFYTAALATHSGTGATQIVGDPTVIQKTSHGIYSGRIVTITNAVTLPNIDGTYIATRIDANNFSIPIETVGMGTGTCDFDAEVITFQEIQGAFNTIVNLLNEDTGVLFNNYPLSSGTTDFEVLITDVTINDATVTVQYTTPFIAGPITIYDGINCSYMYIPDHMGDASIGKQIREGTFIFQDTTFSGGTIGYRTDLSPGLTLIPFVKPGKGDFGIFPWGNQNFGGGFSGVPLRTYIPKDKQRCRYIQGYYQNQNAREIWAALGISYVFRPFSTRAYRA